MSPVLSVPEIEDALECLSASGHFIDERRDRGIFGEPGVDAEYWERILSISSLNDPSSQ